MKAPESPSDLRIPWQEPEAAFTGPQVTAVRSPLGVTREAGVASGAAASRWLSRLAAPQRGGTPRTV